MTLGHEFLRSEEPLFKPMATLPFRPCADQGSSLSNEHVTLSHNEA